MAAMVMMLTSESGQFRAQWLHQISDCFETNGRHATPHRAFGNSSIEPRHDPRRSRFASINRHDMIADRPEAHHARGPP